MNKRINVFALVFLVFCSLLIIASCKKKDSPYSINYQYQYYPLDSNHYVTYRVDSVFYSYNGAYTRDTVSYDWMVLISDSTFYDNSNRLTNILECYRRPDSTYAWNIDRRWSANRTLTNLQVNEDDIRFIKLVFPPQLNQGWNGNLYVVTTPPYDVFASWNYTYTNMDTTFILNGVTYNHALVVSEVDNENLIQKTLRREAYVQGVGLIYQEWESLSKQNINTDWNTGPENGFRIRMRATGHNP